MLLPCLVASRADVGLDNVTPIPAGIGGGGVASGVHARTRGKTMLSLAANLVGPVVTHFFWRIRSMAGRRILSLLRVGVATRDYSPSARKLGSGKVLSDRG